MKHVLENLLALQTAELGKGASAKNDELRKTIPLSILQNYDRSRERGKKGVALVRRGVCGQCHMQVAVGLLADLRRDNSIQRCANCGCYLLLEEEPAPVLEVKPRATKPGRGRPRKTCVTHAAA